MHLFLQEKVIKVIINENKYYFVNIFIIFAYESRVKRTQCGINKGAITKQRIARSSKRRKRQ